MPGQRNATKIAAHEIGRDAIQAQSEQGHVMSDAWTAWTMMHHARAVPARLSERIEYMDYQGPFI